MKISVVTISFNQVEYLSACIESVAAQQGPIEYIIVDPGSTDGSRDIIEANSSLFSDIVFDKDDGPADGLNQGFSRATGDVYYYLNSDDIVLPHAFEEAREYLKAHPDIDVVSGHGYFVDKYGKLTRKIWSDRVTRIGLAYGASILIQPSTFIRKRAFNSVGGFNTFNHSCWDGELVVDLYEKGATFGRKSAFWSGFRMYDDSISGSGRLRDDLRAFRRKTHKRLLGREPAFYTKAVEQLFRAKRIVQNPNRLLQKIKAN